LRAGARRIPGMTARALLLVPAFLAILAVLPAPAAADGIPAVGVDAKPLSTLGGKLEYVTARAKPDTWHTTAPAEQLVEGIRVIAQGDALLAPSVTKRLIHEFSRGGASQRSAPASLEDLTPRELEVFKLIARGMSNAEIAAELVVSETTVKTHVARVLMKLGVRDRVQAVVLAYESGVVAPGATASE
jgi:DNA-binding CsgD family transcriptional regulator